MAMGDSNRVIILSGLAVLLAAGIVACIIYNPLIAGSLSGALFAIAAIIRAINGRETSPSKKMICRKTSKPASNDEDRRIPGCR